ncbi:hypothetical protein BG46_24110 [Brucella anthropi]|uniref:hypothetical protein n=1 Tax=Brucella anthropi TaxID=529 RepID=UPI000450FB9B|nr:hypothetical protein [Brucella anthropi]EXL04851.1 hypothetical protein BG46_24110 [Brucella anthropi]
MQLPKYKVEELRAMDPDEALEELKRFLAEHKKPQTDDRRQKHKEYMREWRKKNAKSVQASKKKWEVANPEKHREQRARTRARFKERGGVKCRGDRKAQHQRYASRKKLQGLLRLEPEKVTMVISRQLPKYLTAPARNDVFQSVFAAIVEGKILYDELSTCAKPFIAAYNRQYDYFKTVSIDAPIAGTDGLTRGDMLSNETPHF